MARVIISFDETLCNFDTIAHRALWARWDRACCVIGSGGQGSRCGVMLRAAALRDGDAAACAPAVDAPVSVLRSAVC